MRFDLAAKLTRVRAEATLMGARLWCVHGFRDPLDRKMWRNALNVYGSERRPNCCGRNRAHEDRCAMDVVLIGRTGQPMRNLPARIRRTIQWGGIRVQSFGCVPGSFHLALADEGGEPGWGRLRADLEAIRCDDDASERTINEVESFQQMCDEQRRDHGCE